MNGTDVRAPTSVGLDVRLVPAAVGAWTMTVVGIVGPLGITVAASVSVSVVALVAIAWTARGSRLLVLPVVLGVAGTMAGFGWALVVRQHQLAEHPLAAESMRGSKTTMTLRVSDDPRIIAGTDRVVLAVDVVSVRGRDVADTAATVLGPMDGWSGLVPGQTLSTVAKVSAPRRPDLTVATLTVSAPPSRVRAPPWYQRAGAEVRTRFQETASRALGTPESGLVPGMVLGDISTLDEDLKTAFRTCGLSHLTAVSGANFAIIIGALLLAVRAVGAGPRLSVAVIACAIVVFVLLVRPSPSVVRAAVMGAVGLLALLVRRRAQAMPALCTAIVVLLLIWPAFAVHPGFMLSVAATAGLIVMAPPIVDQLRRHRVPGGLAEVLAVAVAAQVVTLPIVVMISGQISLVAIVANIAVTLAVPPITVLGTAAAALVVLCPPLATLLVRFVGPALWWMVVVAEQLSSLPMATITLW
ncbi:ComEC/Rec2 family competence protein [Williamsia muralis]|uniref:ComEC/Rec2 family competence protein n=1 Tax=Williamsia marianensis TaxID=85044 RepID=A0ABU4EZH6_WILMA|nr:ComEC/Rec2 family competence protein [Williamsia muralis]MDV7136116.1 ComEC/Rec2 family competence protein [Williamsia muralis]